MFPAYGGMNAYPYQRNQSPSVTYYHPSWEAVPPQTKEEPPSSGCTHESWPHYGFQVPMQCHNCYSHGQHPGYYDFRPPCSHFPHLQPPPPPAYSHFCGGYPPYHQPSYPMYCAPPPPHYSVELPRYDYDKSAPRDQFHCCGCPNHTFHLKERNGVKIEEQEPDVESKKSEPLFPTGASNFPYPIVWYPPGFAPNKEQPRRLVGNESIDHDGLQSVKKSQMPRRSIESDVQDNEGSSLNKKPQWSLENADPNFGYRWFPFDMNNIKQFTESGEPRKTHDQEKRTEDEKTARYVGNTNQNEQMPFPIIWVPYDKLLKNHSEDQVENTKAADESPATSSVSPRKIEHADNEEVKGKTSPGNEGRTCTTGVEKKSSNVRTIPVKQLDESVPKLSKKEEECKPSSFTKKPKLPPICLRVDPPKKKNGNGSSRSPSPPIDKNRQDSGETKLEVKSKKPQEIKVKDIKDKTPQDNKIEVSYNTSGIGGVEKNMEHDNNSNSGIVHCGDGKVQAQESQANEAGGVEKKEVQIDYSSKSGDDKCVDDKVQAQESLSAKENEAEPQGIQKGKVMSEMEAAVAIQSAYRGYNLRRWEPLKKLKLIDNVREEAMQVKKNIEDLEARDDIDDKMKTIIGETIMKLLLKLDTIQGLHESIRDNRRSLAKELTSLQEKLDSIKDRKYILHAQDTSTVQAAEDTPKTTVSIEASKGISEADEDLSKGSSLDGMTNTSVSEESNNSSSHQPLPSDGNAYVSSNLGIEESLPMQSLKETEDELSMCSDGHVRVVEDMKIESLVSENKDMGANMYSELPEEVIETSAAIESVEDVAEGNGLLSRNHDQEANQPLDLPEVANEQSLVKTCAVQDTTQQENESDNIEDQEADVLSELPRKVVEEDTKVIPHSDLVMESPEEIKGQRADIVSEVPREGVEKDEKDMPQSELEMESSHQFKDHEADILSELPQEVVEEDKKEMPFSDIKVLGNLNDDNQLEEMSRHNEKTSATNHDHDNNPLEVSFEETQIGVEGGIVDNTSNLDISVTKEEGTMQHESTDGRETDVPQKQNEVEDVKEIEDTSNGEFSLGKNASLKDPPRGENNDTTVDDQGNESETLWRGINDVECSFETSSLAEPLGNNEQVPELLIGDQHRESEDQVVNESVMQQSKTIEQQARQFPEVQSSATADENEVQAEKKIKEENEKLRELLEKLLESGKEQQEGISSLSGKVKDLEKKLAKRKSKSTKHPRIKVARSCGKPAPANGSLRGRLMGTAS